MSVLALIPARGGSKGIPGKNKKSFAGRPLLVWSIDVALESRLVDEVVVSTDDEELAAIAREGGAAVPFLRPAHLAADDTPGVDPVLHALEMLPEHAAVVVLQPTSPLRTVDDLDGCMRLAHERDAPACVSVCEPPKHPFWMYSLDAGKRLHPLPGSDMVANRQDLPRVYALNGAVFYARADWLRKYRAFVTPETVGYIMPAERSIDLDTMLDWHIAETLVRPRS